MPYELSPFGPPERWRADDLIAVSREFDAGLVLAAYRAGVFPMPTGRRMGWYSPVVRGVLPLAGLRVSRSLRKMLSRYEVRTDTAFEAVLDGCADRRRPGGWIDDRIARVYRELHAAGVVHSVEPGRLTDGWPAGSTG